MLVKRIAILALAGLMPFAAAAQQDAEVKFWFKENPTAFPAASRPIQRSRGSTRSGW